VGDSIAKWDRRHHQYREVARWTRDSCARWAESEWAGSEITAAWRAFLPEYPESAAPLRLRGGGRSLRRTILRVKFPVKQGINREFPHFQVQQRRRKGRKRRKYGGFVTKFPTQPNREF
jgi:hypothetical protein